MEQKYKVEIKPSYEWAEKAKELGITRREVEVFALMTEGYNNKEIADIININYQSVKNHNHHFTNKLGVKNNNQALIVALHLNLIKAKFQSEYINAEVDAKGLLNELREELKGIDKKPDISLKDKRKIKNLLKEYGIDPDKW